MIPKISKGKHTINNIPAISVKIEPGILLLNSNKSIPANWMVLPII
jgi:hypothetical protein